MAGPASERPRTYPPYGHILRHLALDQRFQANGEMHASMPITDDLRDAGGAARFGALLTLADSAAGVLSHERVRPDWLATTDMKVHLIRPTVADEVDSVTRVVREGRRNVLSEIRIFDTDGDVAKGWVTYARLPRRDDTPSVDEDHDPGRRLHYLEDRPRPRPVLDDYVGLEIDPAELRFDLVHNDRIRNSFGSIQGGVAAMLIERMAVHLAELTFGRPARATDVHLHFLGQGTEGPFEITGRPIRIDPAMATVEVEVIDRSSGRLLDLGTASAVPI